MLIFLQLYYEHWTDKQKYFYAHISNRERSVQEDVYLIMHEQRFRKVFLKVIFLIIDLLENWNKIFRSEDEISELPIDITNIIWQNMLQ